MMTIKGIPSTYNKDLQESVEPMLEHVKTLKDSLAIATRVLGTLTVFPDKMRAALTPDMLATDLAEYLVRKGTSFCFPSSNRKIHSLIPCVQDFHSARHIAFRDELSLLPRRRGWPWIN